jgi:hypothetical protein
MSLKIGGSKSKTKTTSNSTLNSTTTPIAPEWASSLTQNVAGRVGSLLSIDPYSLVPSANPLQTQAASGAAGLSADTSWLTPYLSANTPFASGGKAYDFVDRYMNPYLGEVVDSSAADFDANAGQVRAQQALDLAGSGAFGGSGAALTQSMTEGELSRARASTLSGLRSHAYDTALGAAGGDADRATQARIANAQMSLQDAAQKVGFRLQSDANQRANIATQADIGGALRSIDQAQRQAPIWEAQQVVAMLNGMPVGLFMGEQKNQTESRVGTEKRTEAHADAGVSYNKITGWGG